MIKQNFMLNNELDVILKFTRLIWFQQNREQEKEREKYLYCLKIKIYINL